MTIQSVGLCPGWAERFPVAIESARCRGVLCYGRIGANGAALTDHCLMVHLVPNLVVPLPAVSTVANLASLAARQALV